MRRAQNRQTCWSEALFTEWQVQDSNLRRHTPTDLQNVDAHSLTWGFTAPLSNFRTSSPQPQRPSRDTRREGARVHHLGLAV